MPVLLLTTTGRRTGRATTTPLTYLEAETGELVVVGSNGGEDSPPSWWRNLLATPEATITIGTHGLNPDDPGHLVISHLVITGVARGSFAPGASALPPEMRGCGYVHNCRSEKLNRINDIPDGAQASDQLHGFSDVSGSTPTLT